MRVRLAELIAALSLATDLGLGLPQEHVLRQTRIALGLAERLGLDPEERAAVYYVALLAWVGCTADGHELAAAFGDDIELRASSYRVDRTGRPMVGYLLRRTRGPLALPGQARVAVDAMATHCRVAASMAAGLGLDREVEEPLRHMFSRWDGVGVPGTARGEAVPLPTRIVQVADVCEVHHRAGGVGAAVDVARRRAGGQFDPQVAAALIDCADELLPTLDDGGSSWDEVIAAEPGLVKALSGEQLDEVLEAVADFGDLKSPWFSGHSRGVARLAAAAGRQAGLPEDAVGELRRAALLHDLGRAGVPNTVWDKPGPLTQGEHERVRLHPYYTERVLARATPLASAAAIAASHHERLDGSGYHRALPGATLSPAARLLAAADVYHALLEPRPHRPARDAEQAWRALRDEVRAGRLDGDAAHDVLVAAGHTRGSDRDRARPAGLTARELEVLVLVARGASSRDVAHQLVITGKTARNHIQRIYSKLGVSSRAEASLYAMRHGLVD